MYAKFEVNQCSLNCWPVSNFGNLKFHCGAKFEGKELFPYPPYQSRLDQTFGVKTELFQYFFKSWSASVRMWSHIIYPQHKPIYPYLPLNTLINPYST